MRHDVGIGEYKVSNVAADEIKTYALGSCVGIAVYDKTSKVGGLLHVALPDSTINEEKARIRPGYFVDTGMELMFSDFRKKGGNLKRSVVKIAGGASIMDDNGTFDIGRRNVIAIKRFLWKMGMGVLKEDVGGKESRTMSLFIEDGGINLSNAKRKWNL